VFYFEAIIEHLPETAKENNENKSQYFIACRDPNTVLLEINCDKYAVTSVVHLPKDKIGSNYCSICMKCNVTSKLVVVFRVDRSGKFLTNDGNHPQDHNLSHSGRSQSAFSPL
jgi:hypothetical protein